MLVSAAVLAMPVRRMRRAMPPEKQQITGVLRARKSASPRLCDNYGPGSAGD
jgi:hypothetical protein